MSCLCKQIAGPDISLSPVCIGQLWMFKNLSKPEMTELAQAAQRKRLKKGEVLFLQADPAQELFLIKGGRIKLEKVFEDGSELTLDIRKGGDFVGENTFSEGENILSAPFASKIPWCADSAKRDLNSSFWKTRISGCRL